MSGLTYEQAARMRAAIARDQRLHWWRLFWESAPTKRELERRERLWMWWGSIEWAARQAARGVTISRERSFARESG
jgi:hypothetical protein